MRGLCKNLLYSTKQVIDRAVDLMQGAIIEIEDRSDQAVELIQGALIDIEDRKRELDNLDDILSPLDDTLYKSTQKEEGREVKKMRTVSRRIADAFHLITIGD